MYTQSGTLQGRILDLSKHNQITVAPLGSHATDRMIGSVGTKTKKTSSKNSSTIITLPDSPTGDSSAKFLQISMS